MALGVNGMARNGPSVLRLDGATQASPLHADIGDALSVLRGIPGRADVSVRFANHFAGAGGLSPGGKVAPGDVVEIIGYDPVRDSLATAGPAPAYPWAHLHWLVLRVCPRRQAVVQLYDDPALAVRCRVDHAGIAALEPALKALQADGVVVDARLGAVAVSSTAKGAAELVVGSRK